LEAGQESPNLSFYQSIASVLINNISAANEITKLKIMGTILNSAASISLGNHANMKMN
jgi:hypothetical protein